MKRICRQSPLRRLLSRSGMLLKLERGEPENRTLLVAGAALECASLRGMAGASPRSPWRGLGAEGARGKQKSPWQLFRRLLSFELCNCRENAMTDYRGSKVGES